MLDIKNFDADELLALAYVDIEAKRIDFGMAKLKQALQLAGHSVKTEATIARIYAQLGLFDKAKAMYQIYLDAEPKAYTEKFQLGMVNFDDGDLDVAVGLWGEVLRDQETYPPALYYRATAHAQLGNNDQAMRDIDVLLQSADVENLYFNKAKELKNYLKGDDDASITHKPLSELYEVDS